MAKKNKQQKIAFDETEFLKMFDKEFALFIYRDTKKAAGSLYEPVKGTHGMRSFYNLGQLSKVFIPALGSSDSKPELTHLLKTNPANAYEEYRFELASVEFHKGKRLILTGHISEADFQPTRYYVYLPAMLHFKETPKYKTLETIATL